jgi:hypothetical protein
MAPRTPVAPLVLTALAHGSVASHTPSSVSVSVRADRMERMDHLEQRSQARSSSTISFSFPKVDQHIVAPEVSQTERIDGRKVENVGSLSPHADAQALTGFLLAAHVLRAYVVATELLTRSSVESDFATDVCIRKRGIDPETDARYLEELSFEIVNEQSLNDATAKAKNLARRGVRRVFAIFVKSAEICEWSKERGEFIRLDMNGMFDDPVFVRPIAVKALVDSTLAEAENEVAKALIAKQNPEITRLQREAAQDGHKKGLDEGHKKGLDEGHRQGLDLGRSMLRSLLSQRFGALSTAVEHRVDTATAEQLEGWSARLFSSSSIDELFA